MKFLNILVLLLLSAGMFLFGFGVKSSVVPTSTATLIQAAPLSRTPYPLMRSDRSSQNLFERAARVMLEPTRPIASAWYYRDNIWITNRHVCEAFEEYKAQFPSIQVAANGSTIPVTSYIKSRVSDLCAMAVLASGYAMNLKLPTLANPETIDLITNSKTIAAAGYPQAEKYQLRVGYSAGERQISLAEFGDAREGSEEVLLLFNSLNMVVEPGMSGSAVYDTSTGEVVGVIAAMDRRWGYMVPVSSVIKFLKEEAFL